MEIQDSSNNVSVKVHRFMDSLNLTYNSSDTPHGLALLYSGLIDTVSFNSLKAVLYYYNANSENKVKAWIDNSGSLQLDQNYSKLSYFVLASEDIYRFDQIEGLGSNQVFMMLDQTAIPSDQYYSEFQTKIDKEFAALPEDPPDSDRWCSRDVANCPDEDIEGTCTPSESQLGGEDWYCGATFCPLKTSSGLLNDNNTPFDSTVSPDMYKIRDNVILNDNKYEYLIDDYYYLATKIGGSINLSIALDIKDLSNTNFLDIFKNYNNPIYADSVLITSVSKPIILDICNASKNLTNDTRAINIINNTINLANTYENKTITYIKNN